MSALLRVPGIHHWGFQFGQRLAARGIPNDQMSGSIPCDNRLTVWREGDRIQHGRKMMRRLGFVPGQCVDQLARFDIPDLAQHIVSNARDPLAIGRNHHFSNPTIMGSERSHRSALLQIPPDQLAVIATRDKLLTNNHRPHDITLVPIPLKLDQFWLFQRCIDFINLEVRTANE